MQNIGAYGVEIKDHFAWLDAVRLSDGSLKRFTKDDCAFGYRESVFKREEKGKWILVQVAFDLDRESPLRMGYGAIEQELASIPAGTTHPQGCERCCHSHPSIQVARSEGNRKCGVVLQEPHSACRKWPRLWRPILTCRNIPSRQARSNWPPAGSLNKRDGKGTVAKHMACMTGKPSCLCTTVAQRVKRCGPWPKTSWHRCNPPLA